MSYEVLAALDPPLGNSASREFWRGIDRGELTIPRCTHCGRWQWYPVGTGCCRAGELVWTALAGTGRIFTFTTVHFDFLPGVMGATPYDVALIEMDGAEGVRLVGLLALAEPVIGEGVRVEFIEGPRHKFPIFVESK